MEREQQVGIYRHGASSLADLGARDAALAGAARQLVREHVQRLVDGSLPGATERLRATVTDLLLAGGLANGRALLAGVVGRDAGLATEARTRQAALARLVRETATLESRPLRDHPALARHAELGRLHALAEMAGLSSKVAAAITADVTTLAAVDDDRLADLVKAGRIGAEEARSFGAVVTLFNALGGDARVITAVLQRLGSAPPSGAARFDRADWRAVIDAAGATPPGGITAEGWADRLRGRLGALYPLQALLGRLSHAPEATRSRLAVPLLERLASRNRRVDLLRMDTSRGSRQLDQLDHGGAPADEQTAAIGAVRTLQRVWALAREPESTVRLLVAGYGSALSIMSDGYRTFARKTGLDESAAKSVYAAAGKAVSEAASRVGTIVDLVRGGFDHLQVSNIYPEVDDYLKQMDGFADLFGSQAMCRCQECESIIGPSAYFVDLMCFVAQNVTSVYFTDELASHPLRLSVRRPDLWTLELTCDNCDDLVPTLDIVNLILENYVAQDHGYAGDLDDRDAVGEAVYRDALLGPIHSLKQPFHLPLLRLETYLGYFDRSRYSVADTVEAPPERLVESRLGVSQRQRELITEANLELGFLRRVYGIGFQISGNEVEAIQAKRLYRAMELTRDELGILAATRFVLTGAPDLSIVTEKKSADSLQPDIERIHHLTLDGLDRMHRVTRLWRGLSWTFGELDLVLTQLGDTTLGNLAALTRLLDIQDQLGAPPVEELCALVGSIPQLPIAEDETGLWDRLFNPSYYLTTGGISFPQDDVRFVHPSLRATAPASSDTTLARLLGGLLVGDEDFIRLITGLVEPLGADLDAAVEEDRGFLLTVDNLSLLYRHARLAERLSLEVGELFQLIALAGLGTHVADAGQLLALLEFHTWWDSTDYELDDLAYVTGGAEVAAPEVYPDAQQLAEDMVSGVATDKSLLMADTVFAYFSGVTEAQSRRLVAALMDAGLLERASDGVSYWLTSGFSPSTTLEVPDDIPVAAADALELLVQHHASRIVPSRLATALAVDVARVGSLLAMVGVDLSTAYTRVLQGSDPVDPLVAAVAAILPLTVLFEDSAFDADALAFISGEPDRFGVQSFTSIPMAAVRKLSIYAVFAAEDAAVTTTSADPRDPADVRAVLEAFTPAGGFAAADSDQLAGVLRAEAGLVSTVVAAIALPPAAPEALDKLARSVALTQELGVSGDFLSLAVSNDYDDLQRAADAVLSAVRAGFADEEEWEEKIEPYDDTIREGKRTALVDYLTRTLDPAFADADAIYKYFLIDPQLAGCARTSWVVSATSSVQLYVNRVLMNLEQDDLAADDPGHVAVPPDAIPADEWVWRKNYRVWQANRKVFLWPENYIEPELRDDKSPQFEDLENLLLQQSIDDDSALDAYGTYLHAFDEVAGLTIVGAWHDTRDDLKQDVLHLIGVVPGDPPLYYYRTAENLLHAERDGDGGVVWSPWQKIDVQITARQATPVVHQGRLRLFWCTYQTKARNTVQDGSSEFDGYTHTMAIKYTSLRADGRWTPPQDLTLPGGDVSGAIPFGQGAGQIRDMLIIPHDPGRGVPEHAESDDIQDEPLDDYTLEGDNWDRLYVDPADDYTEDALTIVGRDYMFYGTVDLYHRSTREWYQDYQDADELGFSPLLCAKTKDDERRLYYGTAPSWRPNRWSYADMVLDEDRMKRWMLYSSSGDLVKPTYDKKIAVIGDADLMAVGGELDDILIQTGGDALLLMGSVRDGNEFLLRRIGTTLADTIGEKLFTDGLEELLATDYQLEHLKEAELPITLSGDKIEDGGNAGTLDFKGAFGGYYREIFFHIPFLIANYLSSQGQYESAQAWYQYIFDPTAAEETKPPRDRNWRYAEFRGLGTPDLVEILTDADALEVYRSDPFNPHAIARLRLSAYQKCIVMKYVDNLLDWGDSLFTEFTTESLGEATMLYVMAQDILGPRPEELGDCTTSTTPARTYADIESMCKPDNDFLIEIENYSIGRAQLAQVEPNYVLSDGAVKKRLRTGMVEATGLDPGGPRQLFRASWKQASVASRKAIAAGAKSSAKSALSSKSGSPIISKYEVAPSFGLSVIRQVGATFCIPQNDDLIAYWDRVEDRLYKLRNCMDIEGNRRLPALFAPPIDPALLVRAKALGLSLEDVLSSVNGELPPYRFLFLIEKAKQYAASLQGYGAALLSALEKKDIEELAQLRAVHQENLLQMATRMRQQEIDAAQKTLESLQAQIDATTWRQEYYEGLIDQDLTTWETAQRDSQFLASGIHGGEAILFNVAASVALIMQTGSPFAAKWGGVEMKNSTQAFGFATRATAKAAESVAASTGLLASYERRTQGWEYQRDLAGKELKSLEKQYDAAQLRLDMANRGMEIHETSVEQAEEVYTFFKDKFSNLGLYTYLSSALQRHFRDAYNGAYAMAKLAEQAYLFERNDDTSVMLDASYWDSSHNGLLAGEQLLIDLQAMERRFLETNYRPLEVDQSFSLLQIDPAALIQLRQTGSCQFTIPELYFDLFYPGHYLRRIKSVRLTIPSVTGPYTNVSATLTLLGSKIRRAAELGDANLLDVPPRRSVSIATSSAQNDAGVFELSFRDERYMPFEGAGAVSTWELRLPRNLRPFDYQTMTDVIVSMAYTAESSSELRDQVDAQNDAIEGSLLDVLGKENSARAFSLRQDFSPTFSRLLHSPAGTAVPFEITDKHFPLFLTGRALTVKQARMVVRPASTATSASGLAITLDGKPFAGFTPEDELGGLLAVDLGTVLTGKLIGSHSITVTDAGDFAPASLPPGDVSALDSSKLADLLIYVEYRVA